MLKLRFDSKRQYLSLSLFTIVAAVSAFIVVSACTGTQATAAKVNIVTSDTPPAPGVVATINGQNITEEQLIGDDKMDFFELKKREYDLRMDRLNQLIIEKMVGDQAQKAGMKAEDYLKNKVIGEIKISDSDFKKFVKEKNIPESQATQLKDRIMNYLQQQKRQDAVQAYLAKVTAKDPVQVYFKKPKMVVAVDPGNGPWWGNDKAGVTIVEFSDFQCPYCKQGAERVHDLKKKYGNKVHFVYRQFPLPPNMHPNARAAAEASLCVNEQGMDKFWKYHDLLFANQSSLDESHLSKFAKEAGADEAKFDECVKAKKFSQAVQADMDYGNQIGVRSTPTFFINGEIINGALPVESFSEIIDENLNHGKSG